MTSTARERLWLSYPMQCRLSFLGATKMISASATTRTMIMPSLNGKTALVTGASGGMGRASALALAAAGAQVLVHYGRGAKEADGVVAEIRKAGGRADALAMDLATADGAGKLAKQA